MSRRPGPRRKPGTGSIYYRARDGVWTAAITLAGQRHTHACHTEREAERWLERALAGSVQATDADRLTVAAYLEQWLEDKRPGLAPSTAIRYGELLRRHVLPVAGARRLAAFSAHDALAAYRRMRAAGLSESTVHRVHTLLRAAIGAAVLLYKLPEDPMAAVPAPRDADTELRVFDLDESRRFLAAIAGDPLEALYLMALATGMREGELLALRWSDLDLERGLVTVSRKVRRVGREGLQVGRPKTRAGRRTIAVMAIAVAALRRYRSQQSEIREVVFRAPRGGMWDGGNFLSLRWYPLLARAGLPRVRFHALRHSACTLLLAAGVPATTVQRILGHADVRTTMGTYAHYLAGADAAAVARLEALLTGGD